MIKRKFETSLALLAGMYVCIVEQILEGHDLISLATYHALIGRSLPRRRAPR